MQPAKLNQDKFLRSLFWILTFIAIAIVAWKFFWSQEQPMETKILYVFSTFLVSAILFRQIRKRAQEERLHRWCTAAIEWWDTGISAVVLAFFIMAFIMQAFKIPSGSMIPTLEIGDHLFVNKFIYGTQIPFSLKKLWSLKDVKRNDVIVFLCPPPALSEDEHNRGIKKDFIKRCVALAGDIVEIRNKVLYLNGEKAYDPKASLTDTNIYAQPKIWKSREDYQSRWEQGKFVQISPAAFRDNFGPVKVPENNFFVMGDNRDGSFDSRFWGPLHQKYLKGKAWLVYFPPKRFQAIR